MFNRGAQYMSWVSVRDLLGGSGPAPAAARRAAHALERRGALETRFLLEGADYRLARPHDVFATTRPYLAVRLFDDLGSTANWDPYSTTDEVREHFEGLLELVVATLRTAGEAPQRNHEVDGHFWFVAKALAARGELPAENVKFIDMMMLDEGGEKYIDTMLAKGDLLGAYIGTMLDEGGEELKRDVIIRSREYGEERMKCDARYPAWTGRMRRLEQNLQYRVAWLDRLPPPKGASVGSGHLFSRWRRQACSLAREPVRSRGRRAARGAASRRQVRGRRGLGYGAPRRSGARPAQPPGLQGRSQRYHGRTAPVKRATCHKLYARCSFGAARTSQPPLLTV